jgi:hypothetical protein
MWSLHAGRMKIVIVCGIVLVEMAMGLLQLMKAEALYPMVAFVLGLLSVRASRIRMAIILVTFFALYDFATDLTGYARLQTTHLSSGSERELDLSTRSGFYDQYFKMSPVVAEGEQLQQSLLRLSYTNAAAFVVSRYDRGVPGDSMRDVLYSFIPRFLWPNKPLVLVGGELATLATDTIGNSISCGYFAEVYWNFGWLGMLLLLPMGLAFSVASRLALRVFDRGDWHYLPVLFLNLKTAIGVDNFYVGFVGTFIIGFGAYLFLRAVAPSLKFLGITSAERARN